MNPEAKEFNPSFLNTKASAPPSISVPKPKGSPRQDGPRRNQQQQQQQQHQSSARPPRATSSHSSFQRPVRSDGNYPAQRRESEANDEGAAFSRSPGHSGKKGKSLNHLLNFSFPERVQSLPPPRRVVRRQAYNKERYTHASFRFLVCDLDIYQSNITDPDNMVEWEHIEQVIVSNPQEQACPICLEEPKAARMTRCGHVFCFSCVLHYLALGEKSWRRCPICFDAVQATDLKSVRINRSIRYGEGDVLRLVLMERAKAGYVAFPRSSWSQAVAESVPCSDDPLAMRFSKLVRATPAKIEEILLDDLSVLEAQKLEAETAGEAESLPFIEQGIASVKQKVEEVRSSPLKRVTELLHQINQIPNREASKKARSHAEERPRSSPPAPAAAAAATHSKYDRDFSLAKGKRMSVEEEELDEEEGTEESSERSSEVDSEDFEGGWETPFGPDEPPRFSEEEEEEEARTRSSQAQTKKEPEKVAKDARQAQGGPQAKEERGDRAEGKKKPPPAHHTAAAPQEGDPDFLYFYQAEDGQPLFCHPLITRILLTDRGSVASLPDVIEAKIVEMEEMSQNDETRKRFKTTAHLPLTTEFSLCEVDLRTGNLISAETQRTFQPELQQREQRRKSKARKERLKDKQKQRDDINNFERYQRFLDSYAESFPSISSDDSFKPSEEELSSLSEFPEPSRGGAASTSPEAAPAAAAATRPLPKASPPAGSSPTKQHNYATALRVGPGEKPLFSEDDFAPMLSSSSSVPRSKTKGFAAPSSSAGTASLSMDETSFPAPSSSSSSSLAAKKAGPWGAPAKGGESFASVIQKQAPPAGPPQPEAPEEEPKQGGRKDKKKKMVLMSTNLRRY